MSEYNLKIAEEIITYILKVGQINQAERLFMFLYIADKLHLQRYGSFMFDEKYISDSKGPIPHKVKNFLEKAKQGKVEKIIFVQDSVICQRDFDLEHISESNKECIDEALKKEIPLNDYQDEAWSKAGLGEEITMINIASTLLNTRELILLLKDPYPETQRDKAKNTRKPCAG
jgi:hypothetical protein